MAVSTLHVAYDDVSIGLIPFGAPTVAVYVDGRYANLAAARRAFPHATIVTITVLGTPGARFCDCENGDLTPQQAAAWAKAEIRAGRLLPGIYSSVSEWPTVMAALAAVGLSRADVVLWSAHYTGVAHLCSPSTCAYPGFVWTANATQYTDHADGRSLDESLVDDRFLGLRPKPPVPSPHYDRFPERPFRIGDRRLNERKTVELYDRLARHPRLNALRLRRVRGDLVLLRKRIWVVAHEGSRIGLGDWGSPPPTWDLYWRGWRYQQLLARVR